MAPSPERIRGLPQNLAALAAKLTHYRRPHHPAAGVAKPRGAEPKAVFQMAPRI